MSDDHETTSEPAGATEQETEAAADRQSRWARWRIAARERARRTRKGVVLAVAGALLVGGAGGFLVGALATDDDGPGGRGDWSDHPGRFHDDRQGPPPGAPGQLPPATREDDSGLGG